MPPTPATRAGVSLEEEWREKLGPERLKNIDRLHDYWTRGEFVENPVPTGGPGHFILDAKGRPCPLAYIIIASGRRDLIEQAARENNGVKVADLKSGPILEWILHSGLTQEECVLIQQPSRSGQDVARDVRAEEKARLARKLESVEETLRLANGDSLDVAVRRVMALSVQARH